jgi:hypothetical protein
LPRDCLDDLADALHRLVAFHNLNRACRCGYCSTVPQAARIHLNLNLISAVCDIGTANDCTGELNVYARMARLMTMAGYECFKIIDHERAT